MIDNRDDLSRRAAEELLDPPKGLQARFDVVMPVLDREVSGFQALDLLERRVVAALACALTGPDGPPELFIDAFIRITVNSLLVLQIARSIQFVPLSTARDEAGAKKA